MTCVSPAGTGCATSPPPSSCADLEGLAAESLKTAVIDPGKPWQNGADESLTGKLHDQCLLSLEWFRSRVKAAVVIEKWRRHCDTVHRYMSVKYLTAHEFKRQHQPLADRAVFQE